MTARPAMTEEQVQGVVTGALRAYSWRFYHSRAAQAKDGRWLTPMQGDSGFPDLIAAKDGRQLALECKSTKGAKKPKPGARGSELERLIRWEQQEAWLEALAPMSELSQFVGPDELDEVLRVIAR